MFTFRVAESTGDHVWRWSMGWTIRGHAVKCSGQPCFPSRTTPLTPFPHALPGWLGLSSIKKRLYFLSSWIRLASCHPCNPRWGEESLQLPLVLLKHSPDPPGHLLSEPSYHVMRKPKPSGEGTGRCSGEQSQLNPFCVIPAQVSGLWLKTSPGDSSPSPVGQPQSLESSQLRPHLLWSCALCDSSPPES